MKVSIVIPAYNAEKYLADTIQSVLAQTVADWEAIVVDDGSRDRTAEIARTFARGDERIRAVTQENRGLVGARNRGYAEACPSSEFVIFLDSDDLWEQNLLETLIGALFRHPSAVGAHGLARYVDAGGGIVRPGELEDWGRTRWSVGTTGLTVLPVTEPSTFTTLAVRNHITVSGLLIRRASFEKVGTFDSRLKSCEDYNYWLRLSRGSEIAFVDDVLVRYRLHAQNMSKNDDLMKRSDVLARLLAASSEGVSRQERQILARGYRHKQYLDAMARLGYSTGHLKKGRLFRAAQELLRAARSGFCAARGMSYSQSRDL